MATPNFGDKTVWTGDNLDVLQGLNSETVDTVLSYRPAKTLPEPAAWSDSVEGAWLELYVN